MNICAGGQHDGQKIEKDVKTFNTFEIDASYSSIYL